VITGADAEAVVVVSLSLSVVVDARVVLVVVVVYSAVVEVLVDPVATWLVSSPPPLIDRASKEAQRRYEEVTFTTVRTGVWSERWSRETRHPPHHDDAGRW
jgi:hypothetical protein